MDKKVYLLDYKDNQHEYTIKDFEKVKVCFVEIISGDWVLTIIINDNTKEVYDTGELTRQMNFYDGTYYINPDRIDELKDIESHYDLEEDLL